MAVFPCALLLTSDRLEAASGQVTGLPALLIILAVLAVLGTGLFVIVRGVVRKGKKIGRSG